MSIDWDALIEEADDKPASVLAELLGQDDMEYVVVVYQTRAGAIVHTTSKMEPMRHLAFLEVSKRLLMDEVMEHR